jgi:hypothetical protein
LRQNLVKATNHKNFIMQPLDDRQFEKVLEDARILVVTLIRLIPAPIGRLR